jgi:Uma2 family endonuclease
MQWSKVCEEKILQDLPYKIELNEWGNIVMTPASNQHGNVQTKIAFYLMNWMQEGTVLTECSIETSKGIKVADVVWASEAFLQRNKGTTPYIEAPEICVEIISPSNSVKEMMEKKDLYFAKGAREFWLCDEQGNLSFYTVRGKAEKSHYLSGMPHKIIVDA